MKYVYVLFLMMFLLALSWGNTNLTNDIEEVKKCTETEETCVMTTIIQGDTLFTNSVEIYRDKEIIIKNETGQLLFYLIERSDELFKNNQNYDEVVINETTYLYLAVPAEEESRPLNIHQNAPVNVSYEVQVFGICKYQLKASPQIIVVPGSE